MQKRKTFRPWQPEQTTLLPPSPREWLSDDHQVYFLLDPVDELDLSQVLIPAQSKDPRGEKGFDPRMMTMLLLYAYCVGTVSSRKIERACYEVSSDIRNWSSGRLPHGQPPPPKRGPLPRDADAKTRMARKLRSKKGSAIYAQRKAIVEPVNGQIKECRGLRRFLLRGLEKVNGEWHLIAATHNLLKLFRFQRSQQQARAVATG
jgi:hypothetical protein